MRELFDKAARRGVLSAADGERRLAAIGKTTTWEGFSDADLVVEAAIENLDAKRQIFRHMERRTRPDTILATNTSSLCVAQMQQGAGDPSRIAGLHFFNPVHKMPLVEVVRAPATDPAAADRAAAWAAALGKTPVIVRDSPGFVVNRILTPYLNEAGLLLAEGLTTEQVDRVMRSFGMPLGPLELLDQVGLDVAAHVARAIRPAFAERLAPHPGLERMCERGWLGKKSGQGFYVYRGAKRKVHEEASAELRGTFGGKAPPGSTLEDRLSQARERMVGLMVNEAAMCLTEGLGESADVIDLAMVLGTGWAPHRGGPLRYADDRGAAVVVRVLRGLAQELGSRFEPSAELVRRAETGEPFYDARLLAQAV